MTCGWKGTKDARSTGSHGGAGFSQSNHVDRADRADIADRAETADEANHAKTADEANHAKTADEVNLESKTLSHFLRKDIQDTVVEVLTFLKGIVAKGMSYFKGIFNDGDITNSGTITTKNLNVTGKATFFELEIQKAKAAGGMTVNSAGTFHIDAVEVTPDGFVCYQRAEKDGVTLLQTCEPKDQMMCSNGMNILKGGKGNHYYWRLATDAPSQVVTHTIDGKEEKCLKLVLSKTDRQRRKNESPQDIGDIPKVGDDLVQIGNRDNKERQSVMMSCAYNSFDPELKPSYWAHYMGVNDYDISKHRYTWFAANGSNVTGNFKVQSDNGELESIEDYVKGLATNTIVYKMSISPSLYYINADGTAAAQVVNISAYKIQGDKMTQLQDSDKVQVYVSIGVYGKADHGKLTGSGGSWRYFPSAKDGMEERILELSVGGKIVDRQVVNAVKDGEKGKDAITYKLIPMSENVLAYITEDKETKVKMNKVGIRLLYKIMKSAGEQVNFTTLESEGMTLTIQPIVNKSETFNYNYDIDAYCLSASIDYKEIPDNSYTVTLTKGRDIVDQRIVPITFKPKVVFDIDTVNGKITSQIEAANGKINSVERDLNQTKATVGELDGKYSQLKMKSDEISLTVNNGTRPNLLWGSDLDLSEVQDKIQLAYDNGAVIQKNTAKKEELQRQLDATPTNDTAKRNELQTKINVCDNDITKARNKVSECRAAIHKHLGVGLNSTKIDSREWFEYLKGEGISGADALKFKAMKDTAEFTGLFWEIWSGGTRNLKLKPNTEYTLSAWVRTEFDTKAQGYGKFAFEAFKARKEELGERVGRLRFKKTDSWLEPIKEWTRVETTFTTEELQYGSVAMWVNGTKPATLYICRPKLEEGDTATPWCAYDGTVEALLASGLDIKEKKFTATADNFVVQNNRGEQTFLVDKNGNISGFRIAQPFEVYKNNKEWRNGKSYSWYIKGPIGSEDSIFSGSYLDGACVNIYNGTAEEVRMTINICFQRNEYTGARSALAKLILKPAQLFRAIGVRQQTDLEVDGDYITFYPLVPFTLEKTQASKIAKYLLRVRDVFDSVMEVGETYGGIVEKLKVSGIYKGVETLTPSSGYSMKSTDTTIVADTAPYRDAKITLPKNPQVGMEVEIINIGTGFCYLETADNTRIFWNEAKTKETVREHTKISLLYVGGFDNLWIYTTEGVCGEKK